MNDPKLLRMVTMMEQAGKEVYVPKIKDLGRHIDAHVRKNYEPKRVA